MSWFYCDVKPNIFMKKDQKVVQRPVPDAYEFSPIPDSKCRTNDDRFPLSLWEGWFCSTLGVPIPALIGPSGPQI